MSKIKQKFIRFGTGVDDTNARLIPANYTPSNYTPDEVASEGDDKISAHLKGINTAIGAIGSTSGDLGLTSFSAANNQSSPANVTGLAFANGVVRAFSAVVSVAIDATADLYAEYRIDGVQRSSDWDISVESVGDDTLIDFTITSSGQIQYTSANYSGFVSANIEFRAVVTHI